MVTVRRIERGTCNIWGRCDDDGTGGIFTFLKGLNASYSASRTGLRLIIQRVAEEGFVNITDAMSHLVDDKNQIYEFIKGDLRILYFKNSGSVVVCAEGLIKKGQKVDKKAKNRAIEFRKAFMQAQKKGEVRQLEGIVRIK